VVRVACPGEPAESVVRDHSRAWAARQGARVEVVHYDPARGPEGAAEADVWVIRTAELARWAAAGKLQPLPEAIPQPDSPYQWRNLLPYYREQLLRWDRSDYALPLLGESPLCCYRADLFADPKHQKGFAQQFRRGLKAPATWEQLADIAQYFHDHTPTGKPAPSLPPLPADYGDLCREFFTVAAGFARRAVPVEEAADRASQLDEVFSFYYDLKTGRPRIDSPGFVYALRLLQRLQAYRPAQPAPRPAAAFAEAGEGRPQTVLCLADTSWLLAFQQSPAVRNKFAICPMPGGGRYFAFDTGTEHQTPDGNHVPYLGAGAWLMVVPKGSAQAEAGFDLLADLSGPETSNQVVLEPLRPGWGGGPFRYTQLKRERWDAFDLDPARTTELKTALEQTLLHPRVKNPVLCLRTPDEAAHQADLVKELRLALTGGKDATEALKAVAAAWLKRDGERGLTKHKEEYRISLGLLPR
jgi:multiple sugar transport system substrate-binding protein